MDPLTIVLRLLHVVGGILWVGMAVFTTFFLAPAMAELGPDGGKLMGSLQRRGMMVYTPIIALGTLVSGFWLYFRSAGAMGGAFMSSRMGMAFGFGGAVALLAFIVGIAFVMPSMRRAVALSQSLASVPESERGARMAEAQRLRERGGTVTRIVSVLLLVVAVVMAIARYM